MVAHSRRSSTDNTDGSNGSFSYRHNPYNVENPRVYTTTFEHIGFLPQAKVVHQLTPPLLPVRKGGFDLHTSHNPFRTSLPLGTLHLSLAGRLPFCTYPTDAFINPEPRFPKHQMMRVFIGQLPYNVTEMQLGWICHTFGNGAYLFHFERITKTDFSRGGVKVPTGCFHAHMEAHQVPALVEGLRSRLLVDDTGLWVANTEDDKGFLEGYCHTMKIQKQRRFPGRPYGTVVIQLATSTFDPDTFVPSHRRHEFNQTRCDSNRN